MNAIVNKFLLTGDKFMAEMHLRQPGFRYEIYLSKRIVKAYFQHDMAFRDFKDLNRTTAADKVFCDKAFNFAKINGL